jgi:hypothetical protein
VLSQRLSGKSKPPRGFLTPACQALNANPEATLQGNLSQNGRERVMTEFRSGVVPILVAPTWPLADYTFTRRAGDRLRGACVG